MAGPHRHTTWHSLDFNPITTDDIPAIRDILNSSLRSRTCDYTIGGIFMWAEYFDYEFCIAGNTLFIKGDLENHPGIKAFSLPVGDMPTNESIRLLRRYCEEKSTALRFSAIPEDRLPDFRPFGLRDTEELTDWADYLYDADSLATLSGKKLSKKRNHFNRFVADNPGYRIRKLSECDINEIKDAYSLWTSPEDMEMPSAAEEYLQVHNILGNLSLYPFEGIALLTGNGRIAGFTIGEVTGDTLYVHIEKIDRKIAGSGESINKLFVGYVCNKYPQIRYVNREEDTGDPGLRRAKLSYHPAMMLRKYNIRL